MWLSLLKNTLTGTGYEKRSMEEFAALVKMESDGIGRTVEYVVLNACLTEEVGKMLREFVPFVVCWRSDVRDETPTNFFHQFYMALDSQVSHLRMKYAYDYQHAFQQEVSRMGSYNNNANYRKLAKHMSDRALDFVCLLSKDGDEFPDPPHQRNLICHLRQHW